MKKLVLLLLALCSIMSHAQTKVAVYVTAAENVDSEVQKIIGSELTSAIVATKEYSAIERTSEFLSKISEEQQFQRTGAVDDSQISTLGKQFGVNLVCVVNITPFAGSYYIQARLIDVEKATVTATSRETSDLKDIQSIISTSEKLAKTLLNVEETPQEHALQAFSKEYSSVLSSSKRTQISRIEVTNQYTEVYVVIDVQDIDWYRLSESTYIIDRKAGTKYSLLKTDNISIAPQKTVPPKNAISQVAILYFEPLPEEVRSIDIIEPSGWSWKNITLIPYDAKNVFVFKVNQIEKRQQKPQIALTHKYSTYLSIPKQLELEEIIVDNSSTKVYCKFKNDDMERIIAASKDMYIIDENTKKKYPLQYVEKLPVSPQSKEFHCYENLDFVLVFAPIPINTKTISIVHPDNRSKVQKLMDKTNPVFFNCYSITLYHYSKIGEFKFKPSWIKY